MGIEPRAGTAELIGRWRGLVLPIRHPSSAIRYRAYSSLAMTMRCISDVPS
jgi:hypothetical protein